MRLRSTSQCVSFLYILPVILICSCNSERSDLVITTLKCNYKEAPVGVLALPAFSWILTSNERNQVQSAYQVIVADKITALNPDHEEAWNSGKVNSEESIGIIFSDLTLNPGTKYFWKVRVWDQNDIPSSWSKTASFITALFYEKDWSGAEWISMEEMHDSLILVPGIPTWGRNTRGIAKRRPLIPLFRKEFETGKKIESAYLFVSGLGQYKAYINGAMISDDFLSPGWTHYQKTCQYNTYDITDKLIKGSNAIGIIVGNGFYNINNERYRKLLITYGMPKVLAKIQINYIDGSSESVITNHEWKTISSPITYSSMYGGENYDARLEIPDWSKPGLDDSNWQDVLLAKRPGGELVPETTYPVKVMKAFHAKDIIQTNAESFTIDFGQNASGIIKIKVKGNKGDTIKIVPAELINEDNSVNQQWTGSPYYYFYILKGNGIETWQPMFSYYGMRYAQVYGAEPTNLKTKTDKPELLEISLLHTYNSAPQTGSFWCSNPLFNQIDTLIRFGIQSNLQSVVTDCPHREKLGWLEQTYLMGNSIQHNYEVYHLYQKLVRDMMDSQRDNGLIGNIAPEYLVFGDVFTDSPEWGSAIIQVPWLMYKWYNDASIIEVAWESMLRYLHYLDSKAENNIISYGLGDWYDLGPELPGFPQLSVIPTTATAVYYLDYRIIAHMAELLGKAREAELFKAKAEEIKTAYNELLFNPATGVYATGSQSAMAIPLSMGIVEEEYREKVLINLVDSIIANDKALTAGDIGFHYLIDALTEGNFSQLVYDMNNRDDVPGYGYQIKKGATALTESWEALERKSNNHLMLGHIMEWFYTGLGGIRQKENSAAYNNIVIKPSIIEGLEEVKTEHKTSYGTLVSAWKNTKTKLVMTLIIPVNTTAEIYIPSSSYDRIKENGFSLQNSTSIKIIDTTQTHTIVSIGSGNYKFQVKKD